MRKVSRSIVINNCIYEGELSANNFRKSQIRKFADSRSLRFADNKCSNLQVFICGLNVFRDMQIFDLQAQFLRTERDSVTTSVFFMNQFPPGP
jgi:hypothetical protein